LTAAHSRRPDMRHGAWTEEAAERAALYALGALTQTEACAFEGHLEEGCEVCRDEADQYQVTVESLATATLGVEPPVAVLDRVLKDIRGPKTPDAVPGAAGASQQFVFVRADNEGWQETMKGIFVKPLHVDEATGLATSLVRMAAGTNLPAHQHVGVEQFLVLE